MAKRVGFPVMLFALTTLALLGCTNGAHRCHHQQPPADREDVACVGATGSAGGVSR